MSIIRVDKEGPQDEYYTPDYVVEILVPFLHKKGFKTIWCPCDKHTSEYVKVLSNNGFNVVHTHIEDGQDFLTYVPDFDFDAIITNPPFSIKNEIIQKCISYGKPWALLLSATCIQSASLIQHLSKQTINFIIFDRRISYSGDRPPFPSWYFTHGILDKNEFYIYQEDPNDLYLKWYNSVEEHTSVSTKKEVDLW